MQATSPRVSRIRWMAQRGPGEAWAGMQRRTGLDENANTAICTFHFFCAREDGERWASRRAEGGVGFRVEAPWEHSSIG